MQSGKHPVLAWRLHRDLTKDRAADLMGCSPRNFDAFERGENLRPQTVDKLCTLLKCKPEQLRFPIDIEFHGKAGKRIAEALSHPAAAVS
jgi:DNA-binding Xre family transcriptional regulator